MFIIIFEDYDKTGCLYHVASILDLKNIMQKGIKYDDKNTYVNKYLGFHSFFDQYRSKDIPKWVERKKAIYASLNYKSDHQWHSHTAILKIYVDESKCWVCNENLANIIFEPFVLRQCIAEANIYMKNHAPKIAAEYWNESISFIENKKRRKDKLPSYDAEVLVLEDIKPDSIECIYITSDHKIMSIKEWKDYFMCIN